MEGNGRSASSRPYAYDPDLYESGETTVLPEYTEDEDTIVQLEPDWKPFAPKHAGEDEAIKPALHETPAALNAVASVAAEPAPRPAPVSAVPACAPAAAARTAAPRRSGIFDGDDSNTIVLAESAASRRGGDASLRLQVRSRTLQLVRSNGDTCVVSGYPIVIGKGTDADLIVEGNSAVSRHHVRILRDGDVFAAEDLASTNKTYIGSYELPPYTPTILSDGDILKLGNEALRVRIV